MWWLIAALAVLLGGLGFASLIGRASDAMRRTTREDGNRAD